MIITCKVGCYFETFKQQKNLSKIIIKYLFEDFSTRKVLFSVNFEDFIKIRNLSSLGPLLIGLFMK